MVAQHGDTTLLALGLEWYSILLAKNRKHKFLLYEKEQKKKANHNKQPPIQRARSTFA